VEALRHVIACCWRRLRQDQRGAVAVIMALMLTGLVAAAAMAVDLGLMHDRWSRLRGAVDVAALSATYNLASPSDTATNALAGNGFPGTLVSATTGNYAGSASVASAARFTAGATPMNAVKVVAATTSPVLFGRLFTSSPTLPLRASAVATRVDLAGLSAGTTLISVDSNQSAILNSLLGGLLGSSVNLSAVSWQALLNTTVTAAQLLPGLATQVGLSAGTTYGQLANASLTMGQIARAALAALNAGGTSSGTAVDALNGLIAASGTAQVPLVYLLDVTAWKNEPVGIAPLASALNAQVNLFTLLSDASQIVSGGGKTITLSPVINLSGVASIKIQTSIGEPKQSTPYLTFSSVGTSVHTAQVRTLITINLLPLTVTGLPLLNIVLPVYIEAASGTATISAISCGANPKTDATVTATGKTGLGVVYVGTVSSDAMADFTKTPTVSPATLVNILGVITATASSGPNTILSGSGSLTFTQPQIQNKPPLSQTLSSSSTSSVAAILQTNLQLQVSGSSALLLPTSTLYGLLSPVLQLLDPIVGDLLNALGIKLGAMDVTATGVRCGVPVIVQ
jgi:uncharacterized membrane protein